QFNISLCYLGHQEVHENDLIIVSSHIKSSELKKIREKCHNWVFVLIEQRLSAKTLNEFNEIGRIHYLDHFNLEEIFLHLRATSPGKAPQVQARDDTLAIISHDLKNPLNAIRLDAQILLRHA